MRPRSTNSHFPGPHPRVCCFNMIEVVLGLGLMAFGLIATVGLLPVGLSLSRDTVAETYAADSADQFLHFFAVRLKSPSADYEKWDQLVQRLRYSYSYGEEPTYWEEWFTEPQRPAEFTPPPTNPEEEDPWKTWSTRFCRAPSDPCFFKVEQKAGGASATDFTALYRVTYRHYNQENSTWKTTEEWRGALESAYSTARNRAGSGNTIREVIDALEAKTSPSEDDTEALEELKSVYLAPLDLRIEVSWPVSVPYAQRKKALFDLEVYRSE